MDGDRRPVRVAVIGADPTGRGFGARAHVPAVLATPGLELVAVCTAHPETAEAASRLWGVPKQFFDYEVLMADRDIDLVTIAVRVRLHRPIVEAAIEAGKMVYCEWPLCLSLQEAAPLAALASSRRATAGVGLQGRFAPGVRFAKELIDRGDIGRPLSFLASHLLSKFDVQSDRWWLSMEEEGSGAFQVATAHTTDTIQYLLGDVIELSGVKAILSPRGRFSDTGGWFQWTASDTVGYLVRLAGGCLGAGFVTNTSVPPMGFTLRIIGEEGQLAVSAPGYVSFSKASVLLGRAGDEHLREVPVPHTFFRDLSLGENDPGLNVAFALQELVRSSAGREPFHPNLSDAVRLHGILDAIAASSEEGRWCKVGSEPA